MIDLDGATRACALASTNVTLTSMGISTALYANKASWTVAIDGVYALLFPLIHKHFPSRTETENYVCQYVNSAFTQHHIYPHMWGGAAVAIPGQTTVVPPSVALQTDITLPPSTFINKICRKIDIPVDLKGGEDSPMMELGIPTTEFVEVLATSPALEYLSI